MRALGLRRKDGPRRVVDMTGGLAGDASRMAAAGAEVLLIERDPAVLALVVDALRRAEAEGSVPWGEPAATAAWECVDALPGDFDAAYLDPMYPPRKKTALGAQELRILDALFWRRKASARWRVPRSASRRGSAQDFSTDRHEGARDLLTAAPGAGFRPSG